MTRRVGAYMRVSRIGGRSGDGYIAIPLQRERLEHFAETIGVEVPEDAWLSDEDYSGGNTERPAFLELIDRVERGELQGVIVARIDRFSRSVTDGAEMVDRVTAAGGMFGSATEGMDVREPVGRYMLIQMLNNAELQLNMLKQQWSASKRRAVARGAHIGPTPFGYLRVPRGGANAGRLLPHPEYGPLMGQLFDLAAAGNRTGTDLANFMDAHAPKSSGTPWMVSEVKRMLTSRVYLGEVHYRSRVAGVDDLVNANAHEPLVDRTVFDRVQALRVVGVQKVARHPFLLAGYLKCAHCRRSMGGFSTAGTNRATRVYRCASRGAAKHCDGKPVILADAIEAYVREIVRDAVMREQTEALLETAGVDGAELDRDVEAAEADLEQYMANIALQRRMSAKAWQAGADARLAAVEEATAARDAWYRANPARQSLRKPVEQWGDEDYRDYLRGAVQAIFVRSIAGERRPPVADRVRVVWSVEPEVVFHARGTRHGQLPPIDWYDGHPVAGVPRRQPAHQ